MPLLPWRLNNSFPASVEPSWFFFQPRINPRWNAQKHSLLHGVHLRKAFPTHRAIDCDIFSFT